MRFVVTGEWRTNTLLRVVLGCFLVYVVLLWVTNALLFFSQMDFSYASVVRHYRGDEAAFAQPRSYKVLLEISHFHLFAMGILILTMTHLVLFVPIAGGSKLILVLAAFAAALVDEGSGWLVRYVHPAFAWAKLAGFVGVQVTLALMTALVAWTAWRPPTPEYGMRQPYGGDVD